jgi:DNA-binding NtrC family response regulator
MGRPTVLIIGRDETLQPQLTTRLLRHGFNAVEARTTTKVIENFDKTAPDLIIIYSSRQNPEDRLKIIERLRRKDSHVPIILSTKYSSETRAIAALRAGVNDYYQLPVSIEDLLSSAKKLVVGNSDNALSHSTPGKPDKIIEQSFIGNSKPMKEIKSYLLKIAKTESTVFITGETGTGKEMAAGLIHYKSPRGSKPLVCVNCAALPEGLVESELFGYDRGAFTGAVGNRKGKFETAGGGTVFLDEIGDMNSYAQAKILRSIENKEFFHLGGKWAIPMSARVIAATNQDPEYLMAQGSFRKDLYYRLNVARVNLPPLRERKDDLPILVEHAIQKFNDQFGQRVESFSDKAMAFLYRYDWPGNVRELLNLIEAVYINLPSRSPTRVDLPKPIQNKLQVIESGPKEERERILSALLDTNWNKSTAAQKLQWSRMTLYRKIAKHHIVEKRSPERRTNYNTQP